jgi:hypothetical protein
VPDPNNRWWKRDEEFAARAPNPEFNTEEDRPIVKKKRKKRIVKKKVKSHSPNNHFRRIQLLIEDELKE